MSNAPLSDARTDASAGSSAGDGTPAPDAGSEGTDIQPDTTQRVHPKGGEVVTSCGARSVGAKHAEDCGYVTRRVSHIARTHNTVQDDVQKPTGRGRRRLHLRSHP